VWYIPNAYITQKLTDNFSIGLGSFSHFGLGQEWPDNFEGRFSPGAVKTVLTTESICPVVAFKPLGWLSLAFGPYVQYLDVKIMNRAFIGAPVPPLTSNRNLNQTVEAKLKGSDWDLGWNAGVLIQLPKNFALGAAYLSEVRHEIKDGTQQLTRLSDGATIKKVNGSTSITMPATLKLGLAWKPHPWTLEVDAYWIEWSAYRNLHADFSDGTSFDVPKKWKNAWTWRFGVQYALSKYFDLRAGFIYDQSPIPDDTLDPLVPSGNRKLYCVGLGSHFGQLTIDLGYNYLQDEDRRWNNAAGNVKVGPTTLTRVTGKFEDGYAHILSMSISYKF
jgi:long-chain fatty acid transport protein